MCGIYFGCVCAECKKHEIDTTSLKRRGPDEYRDITDGVRMIFARLAVQGVADGMQPFFDKDVYLLANGEIYNHKDLAHEHKIICNSKSDCEIILRLYLKYGIENTIDMIDGQYAFVIYDAHKQLVLFGRDPVGKMPLYYVDGCLHLSSLITPLIPFGKPRHVLPAHIYVWDIPTRTLSKQKYWIPAYKPCDTDLELIGNTLISSIEQRINNCETEFGFLLSGGLDSSAILSLAMQLEMKLPIQAFTYGFSQNAPDVLAAKKVVNHLRLIYGDSAIIWHTIIESIEEGLASIPEVIRAIETYDTTTIRASVPMFRLCKYIRENTNIKVLISGEGSDELFGGYLYNQYAPNDYAFRAEIINRLERIHLYDALRADRCVAYWGMELRPPYLSENLIGVVMSSAQLRPKPKNTKQLLRDSLTEINKVDSFKLLPDEILNGKKEAFSDAVGIPSKPECDWKTQIGVWCAAYMDKKETKNFSPHIPPATAEQQCFQTIFYEIFGENWQVLDKLWLPNQDWIKTGVEPSASILPNYTKKIDS